MMRLTLVMALMISAVSADAATAQPAARTASMFEYVASPTRRKTNFAAIVNQYRKTAPEAAAQLDAMLASNDVAALIQKAMTPLGLRTDNVADCYALWWAGQWLASRGRQDTPSRAQMAAIKAQAELAMRATPAFMVTGDAQKQEMADSFLFQMLLTDILLEQGKTNPEALRAAAAMAQTNARALGLDLAAIELTPTGFKGAAVASSVPPKAGAALAAPLKPVPSTTASTGPAGLVGMWRSDWVENQFRAFSGLTLIAMNNTLVFTRGGYFIDGVPESAGFDDAGAQAVMARNPDSAGRYTAQPGKIVLNYADGHSETVDAKRDRDGWTLNFKGRWMSSKLLFPDGATLSGTYTSENITNAGSGIFVVGDHDFSFALDGRFARGSKVSMTAPSMSSLGDRQGQSGRYRIAGSALILEYSDGKRETLSLFQETRGQAIWLNDQMYSPAQ